MSQERIVPVWALISRINSIFTSSLPLNGLWIQGEISGVSRHFSGHYYFTLKDEQAQISCAMWKSYAANLNFELKDGMKVLVQGYVNVYEKSGRMQLNVRALKQDGLGALYLELEQRKARLASQGYFNPDHKKPKPNYIEDIAIVSGKDTAALHDVISTIQKRWPMSSLTLYPALVQGQNAPKSIISALKEADKHDHDAILLVRGGGSFEDLFCFNDEDLVKTIYDLNTYTVTGIGHEVDYTLVDFVSDHRAVTPTAAAQWVSWDQRDILVQLELLQRSLEERMQQLLDLSWQKLAYLQSNPYLENPLKFIYDKRQRLMVLIDRLERFALTLLQKSGTLQNLETNLIHNMQARLKESYSLNNTQKQILLIHSPLISIQREKSTVKMLQENQILSLKRRLEEGKYRLEQMISLIKSSSPDAILERGYTYITQEDQQILRAGNLDAKKPIDIHFADQIVTAKYVDANHSTNRSE